MAAATDSTKLDAYKQAGLEEFKKSTALLNSQREKFNTQIYEPASAFVTEQANAQPVLTGLLGVWFALSFFPVLTFLIFSLITLVTIGGSALGFVILSVGFFVGTAALLLVGTLLLTAFLALFTAGWTLVAYATYRLIVNLTVAQDLPSALKSCETEARALFGQQTSQSNGPTKTVSFSADSK